MSKKHLACYRSRDNLPTSTVMPSSLIENTSMKDLEG